MNVEDGLKVDGGRDGEDKVQSDADFDVDLSKARDSEGQGQVLEQVDGLGNTRRGVDGDLEIGLDATKVDLDGRGEQEVAAAGQVDGALKGRLGKSKAQLDGLDLVGGTGDDTITCEGELS